VPFSVETLGPSWSTDTIKFSDMLCDRIRAVTFDPKSKLYFRQRISLSIQRGNATSVLGTLPSGSPMNEFFLLL